MSSRAAQHAINTRASTMLAVSWKRVWKEAENGFYFRLPSFPTDESRYQVAGGNRVCSTLQCWSTMSSGGVKFYFAKLFPLLAVESLARADPGYQSPAQLCRPASVRLFIPGCTCELVGGVEGGRIAQ